MKKALSLALSLAMLAGVSPSVFANDLMAEHSRYEYMNAEEKNFVENTLLNHTYDKFNTTDVFEGHPTYLLDAKFWEDATNPEGQKQPSGWDFEDRGSEFKRAGGLGSDFTINCKDINYPAVMSHDLMVHTKGDLVLETQFRIIGAAAEGFKISLSGEDAAVLQLETTKTDLAYRTADGQLIPVSAYTPDVYNTVKAVVHMDNKTVDFYINNKAAYGVPFKGESVDKITITTGDKETMTVGFQLINIYVNYIMNEKFMAAPVGTTPVEWTSTGDSRYSGIFSVASECVDVQSYKLVTASDAPALSRSFENDTAKNETEFYILIPKKDDGISVSLKSGDTDLVTIGVSGEDFTANGQVIYEDFYENMWYCINVITDTDAKTADIELNYQTVAEDIPLAADGNYDTISFTSGSTPQSEVWFDDVSIIKDLPLPTGYPEPPVIPEHDNDVEVGMLMYDMWREGYHYGWEWLSPYLDRMPYLGYYTEGMKETADWEVKWMKENGIDFQIFPWCGTWSTVEGGVPIKKSLRSFEMIDGLLKSEYDMDFCIMWSYPNPETVHGIEDFKEHILPFWVEHLFKNPNYKTVNNKLLMYAYNLTGWKTQLGGEEQFKEALSLVDQAAKDLGFDGFILLSSDDMSIADAKAYGFGLYKYGWHGMFDNPEVISSNMDYMAEQGVTYANPIGMGFDAEPWLDEGMPGVLKPEDFKNIVNHVVENSDSFIEKGNEMGNFITLTCWNEWGEGHYFSPSTTYGFEYLNILREALTTSEANYQALPSEESLARVGVLYPIGRHQLKMRDTIVKEEIPDDLELLQRIDFSNPEDYARVEIDKGISKIENKDGMVVALADAIDPGFFINGIDIEAKKVKMIRVTASQPEVGSPYVFFGTTVEPDTGYNGKRFEATMNGGNEMQSIDCKVYKSEKLQGRIIQLRYDPPDNTRGEFRVKSIELWGTSEITGSPTIVLDGAEYKSGAKVLVDNSRTYMSIYKWAEVTENQDTDYDYDTGHLNISFRDGTEIDIWDGKNEFLLNGEQKTFANAPFLSDGRMYVPIREFFELLGYEVGWDSERYSVILNSNK